MKLIERIQLRMNVLRDLIEYHERQLDLMLDKDRYDYVGGREMGVIFGYQQELNHLKILLQEVKANEPQRANITV